MIIKSCSETNLTETDVSNAKNVQNELQNRSFPTHENS